MEPRRHHHPRAILLDMLNDTVSRLDDMLQRLAQRRRRFQRALRADPPQRTRSLPHTPAHMTTTNPHPGQTRAIHLTLLELHQIHARLRELIREIEANEGLEPYEPDR